MAEIKKLLDDAIETEINNLNSASDKDEKSEVIKNLAALHKLRIEEIKTETEIEEKSERRAMDKAAHDEDATLKAFQLDVLRRLDEQRTEIRGNGDIYIPDIQESVQSLQAYSKELSQQR